jgi:hypothetical protein
MENPTSFSFNRITCNVKRIVAENDDALFQISGEEAPQLRTLIVSSGLGVSPLKDETFTVSAGALLEGKTQIGMQLFRAIDAATREQTPTP